MSIQSISGHSSWNDNPGDFIRTFAGFIKEKDALAYLERAFRDGIIDEKIIKEIIPITLDRGHYKAFSILIDHLSPIDGLKMINNTEICRRLIGSQGIPLEVCKQLDGLGWDPSHFNQQDAFGVTLIQKLSRSGRGESQFFRSLVERIGIHNIQYHANFGQAELERCLHPNGMLELSGHKFSDRLPEITQHGCTVRIHPETLIHGVPLETVVSYVSGKSISGSLSSPVDVRQRSEKQDESTAKIQDLTLKTTWELSQAPISETGSDLDAPRLQDQNGAFPRLETPDFARTANATYEAAVTFGDEELIGSDLVAPRLQNSKSTLPHLEATDSARLANTTFEAAVTFGDEELIGSDLVAPRLQNSKSTLPHLEAPDSARLANATFEAAFTFKDEELIGSDLVAPRLQNSKSTLPHLKTPDFARSANTTFEAAVTFGGGELIGSEFDAPKQREAGRHKTTLVSLNGTTYGDQDASGSELQTKEEPRQSTTFSGPFEPHISLQHQLNATTYSDSPGISPEAQNPIVLRSHASTFNHSHVWLRIHLAQGHGMFKIQDPRDGQFRSYGFYPKNRNQPLTALLSGVPCQIKDDGDYIDQARDFNADLASQTLITAEQGMKVLKYIEKTSEECQTGQRQFHLLGNCVNFVQEIYMEAEIPGLSHFGQVFPPSDFSRHLTLQQSPIAMQYAMLHSHGLLPTIAAHAMSSNALVKMDRPLQMIGQTPHSPIVGVIALYVGFVAARKCWNFASSFFSAYPQAATNELYRRMDALQNRTDECAELMGTLLDRVGHMIDEPQDDISPDRIEEVRTSYEQLRREWIDLSVDIEFLGLDRASSISKSAGRQLVRQTDLLTQRLDEMEPRIRHLEHEARPRGHQ